MILSTLCHTCRRLQVGTLAENRIWRCPKTGRTTFDDVLACEWYTNWRMDDNDPIKEGKS